MVKTFYHDLLKTQQCSNTNGSYLLYIQGVIQSTK